MIKKYTKELMLTLLALLVCSVANAGVKLSVGQVENVIPGSTIEIPVYLESDAAVATIGFDVRFPQGISAISMVKNNERAKGTQGWICDIKLNGLNPGAYRAGLMNLSLKSITAGSGVVATIFAECADQIEEGTIALENIEITLADGKTAEVVVENGSISTSNVYPGLVKFTASDYYNVYPGTEFTVSVALDNDIEVRSFQANLTLPEGFELVEDEETGDIFNASERNPAGVSYLYDNGILVMVNASGDPIEGQSGTLFSFRVKAPEEMPMREYVITLTDFKGQVKGQTTSFDYNSDIVIKINGALPGDIDKDGDVDADDLALFIQALAAGKLPSLDSDDFIRYDANENGVINIADAQAIFNIFMYGSASGR